MHPLLDSEEFLSFRALSFNPLHGNMSFNPLHETLVTTYQLLRQEYLACLVRVIDAASLSWQKLEACLFCLLAVFREIKSELEKGDPVTLAMIPTIMSLLHRLVQLPAVGTPSPLTATSLNVLAKAAPVIQAGISILPPDFLPSAVKLLTAVISTSTSTPTTSTATSGDSEDDDDDESAVDTATAAATAIAALCKTCWAQLASVDVIRAISGATEVRIGSIVIVQVHDPGRCHRRHPLALLVPVVCRWIIELGSVMDCHSSCSDFQTMQCPLGSVSLYNHPVFVLRDVSLTSPHNHPPSHSLKSPCCPPYSNPSLDSPQLPV